MKIFKSLSDITENAKGAVIAIGNFDGIHRGHQALLKAAEEIAHTMGKKFGVLTFEPHPRKLFQPDLPPARLTPPSLKADRLEHYGVDVLFSMEFNWDFASQSAENFIQTVLINGIGASHVIVGHDFCFGQLRKGTAKTIREANIDVTIIDPINDDKNQIISSSRIRELLRKGYIAKANALLGWEWEIQGSIFRGDRRGHDLGYPTANIFLQDIIHPAYGVYACMVQIENEDEWLPAATNIGIRPMFEVPEGQVEAHILNFPDRDIYDRILRVKPVERLRSEAKFSSLDDLIVQIEKDCAQTKQILT
jgi:riboflavin kinase/FMN adenylyltransferase